MTKTIIHLSIIAGITALLMFPYIPANAPFAQPPLVNCNTDQGTIVAFDISKGPLSSGAGGIPPYAIFINDLQNAGFTVRTVNVSNGIPSCIDTLIVTSLLDISVGGCRVSLAYTTAEVSTIKTWVEGGGKLFANMENVTCSGFANPISSAFGFPVDSGTVAETLSVGTNYIVGVPSNLWDNVPDWTLVNSNVFITSQDIVATDSLGNPVTVFKPVQNGCVIIFGDSSWFQDHIFTSNPNNRQLAQNVIPALNECAISGEPEVIPVEIDIKPGSDPNSVNCKPNKKGDINGVVPIGIFSSNSFDATTIDLNTFTLNGNPTSELHGKLHIEDSNAVIHVSTADICAATSVQKGFEDVTLAGENAEGQFEGTDTVRIVKR